MQIIESVQEMWNWRAAHYREGRRIALVPTMGFLHEGHLSLVRDAKKRADGVVVSIFVNPKQFTPHEDFESYPRDFDCDRKTLEKEDIDVLFHPSADEIYPDGYQTHVEVEKLGAPLCGVFRRGHFRGVATVVLKLFNIVRPDVAIFGCKDYQQLQVIRQLVQDLNLNIEIIGHPTVREPNGLAMSSRNAYLNPAERSAALCLPRSLRKAETLVKEGEKSAAAILETVRREIASEPRARLEYASLNNAETLMEVEEVRDTAVLALAVRIGKTRLIDNIILKT
jgi:pantoate--beta-alanine ligase